jgi:hypothetical protein
MDLMAFIGATKNFNMSVMSVKSFKFCGEPCIGDIVIKDSNRVM